LEQRTRTLHNYLKVLDLYPFPGSFDTYTLAFNEPVTHFMIEPIPVVTANTRQQLNVVTLLDTKGQIWSTGIRPDINTPMKFEKIEMTKIRGQMGMYTPKNTTVVKLIDFQRDNGKVSYFVTADGEYYRYIPSRREIIYYGKFEEYRIRNNKFYLQLPVSNTPHQPTKVARIIPLDKEVDLSSVLW
jgi:hypothetical protein